jgi:LysM repeat protein
MTTRYRSKERELFEPVSDQQQQQSQKVAYIDYQLSPADTIHLISMRFGVPVSDLKRINCLQNERDIYALKFLKIPIKENSIHFETFASQLKYAYSGLNRLNGGGGLSDSLDNILDTSQDKSSNDDEERATSEVESYATTFNSGPNTNETTFTNLAQAENDSDDLDHKETTSLLIDNENIAKNNNNVSSQNGTKQAKEAKKFMRKLDNNLNSLIKQNNELLSVVKNNHKTDMEHLVPISNISYSVETRSSRAALKSPSFCNVRDVIFLAVIVVVGLPILFFLYRQFYMSEHHLNP